MSDNTIEFSVLIDANSDIEDSQARLIAAINDEPGFSVANVERIKPLGMSGAEVAISFAVSLVSSALVHAARDQIDVVVKRISAEIKRPLRVVFRRKKPGTTGNPDELKEPDDSEAKPGV